MLAVFLSALAASATSPPDLLAPAEAALETPASMREAAPDDDEAGDSGLRTRWAFGGAAVGCLATSSVGSVLMYSSLMAFEVGSRALAPTLTSLMGPAGSSGLSTAAPLFPLLAAAVPVVSLMLLGAWVGWTFGPELAEPGGPFQRTPSEEAHDDEVPF